MELAWKQFKALGTEIIVSAYLENQERYLLDRAQAYFFEFEQRFSRFVAGSEVNALNNFGGGEYLASERLVDILQQCQTYYRETNGLFNPEVIDILEGIGYDNNFSDIQDSQANHETARQKRLLSQATFRKRPRFSELEIKEQTLVVPKGFRIDLGGIGKGYAVDLIGREVFAQIENYWISAGGDLLASGNDGSKQGWQISVQNPVAPDKESFSFGTMGQKLGIATSGVVKRQGIFGGLPWHHIIDPISAEPANNDILSVSIIAPTATQADVYAKTVLLLGPIDGLRLINDRPELEGAIYLKNKSAIFSQDLAKYL